MAQTRSGFIGTAQIKPGYATATPRQAGINEVAEHSGDWTERTRVSRAAFLTSWLAEYLPVIRVIPDDAVPDELLTPGESARLAELSVHDRDDIPSAKLAMVLGAFYNTRDGPALRPPTGRT